MTSRDDLVKRRSAEAERIAISLARQKGERRSSIKGGEGTVAWVTENLSVLVAISVLLFVMMMRSNFISKI